jgi:tRNA1Val (adenine37-N6)-methyltransferase
VPNTYFQFKQFTIHQDRCAMKVTTDACLFGAWATERMRREGLAINNCLDIGTGTGLLSLMIAQKVKTDIDAVEIDPAAAIQASENVQLSPWADQIAVIHGNIKDKAISSLHKYKIIVSNPPFYENELASDNKQKNIAHHAGGLLLCELAETIRRTMHPNGRFYILFPYKRKDEVQQVFRDNDLSIINTCLVRQSPDHGYFRFFISGMHTQYGRLIPSEDEISIVNENGEYSLPFVDLLKDYYLNL